MPPSPKRLYERFRGYAARLFAHTGGKGFRLSDLALRLDRAERYAAGMLLFDPERVDARLGSR